jgi:hypothetical protein
MKQHFTIMLCSIVTVCSGQNYSYDRIPEGYVFDNEDNRAGSCASPNGPIVCTELPDYPTYAEVYDAGCCYTINPAVKNATYCYTFTSPGTTATLDAAFTFTYGGGFSLWFSDFELFTCAPDCALFGTGLVFTGLTPGQCYTWCFDTHFTGGGGGAGFTSMCPYFIYTEPLPVQLTQFKAYYTNHAVTLNWSTASESNSSYFEIYRSANGNDFEKIGKVDAAGNSLTNRNYEFYDAGFHQGTNYYKLKQVDFDQSFAESNIVFCDINQDVTNRKYFNMSGQLIDFEVVEQGIYLCEMAHNGGFSYELVVKK